MSSIATAQPVGSDSQVRDHVPISASALMHIEALDFDVFLVASPGERPVFYCGPDSAPADDKLAQLANAHKDLFYVRACDAERYQASLYENLEVMMQQDQIAVTERFEILKGAVSQRVEDAFRLLDIDEAVHESQKVGHHLVKLLRENELAMGELFAASTHDFSTFTHLINVSGYCVLLAKELGIRQQDELQSIAVAGMLHDAGKRLIPASIIAKPGPLTPQEKEIIRQHPQKGYEELHDQEDLDFGQLMMVYQHHERIDGMGYPVGILGREMHLMARLCAVVNVFDALTCVRSYRKPMAADKALEHIKEGEGTHFDPEMVRCFLMAMNQK